MCKKAMISQPMRDLSPEEIEATRDKAKSFLESKGYEVVDTYFKEEWSKEEVERVVNKPLFYLAKSLEKMSECECLYLCNGWEKTRGCIVEKITAEQYGLELVFE